MKKEKTKKGKTSINSHLPPDLYLSIFSYIQQYQKLPTHLLPKNHLQYYICRLKKEGFIERLGYGVWGVLKPLNKYKITPMVSRTNNVVTKQVRGHNFVYKINLPKIRNWSNRTTYLTKQGIHFKQLNNFQRITYKGFKVWLCDKSIIVYVPKTKDYFSSTAQDSQRYALYEFTNLLEALEGFLGVSLKIDNKYEFKISRQHYGKVKDALAKQCNRNNEKIYCYHNGKGWLVIDNSKGLNELETIHPTTSPKDMDKVIIPFMNDLKDTFEKTNEVILPSNLLTMIQGVVSNQVMFSQNLKTHTKAIKELSKGVKKFTKVVSNERSNKIKKIR